MKTRVLTTFLLVFVCFSAANAQEVRASLTGIVSDPSGAPVAGATITVVNLSTNITVSAQTNPTGNYTVPFLAPGTYRMTVQQQGFRRFVRENIVLEAQARVRIDASLELGELSQSVTVSESVSLLQTESATRAQVISNDLLANVPTQGRNPFQIAWTAPGVIKTGSWRYLRSFDIGGTSGLSINGGRNKENEVLLDGISNVQSNRTVIHVPTIETVQEFKVLTNTYDSQYGRTGGGIVTIVTKGGGNEFHGTAFEYFQAEELNANQAELNRTGTRKPPMNINTFGIEGSGPVYVPKVLDGRNRLFWLVSYEGMRQRSADPGVKNFPATEWRGGDFSSRLNAQGAQVLIYDPLTTNAQGERTPFQNNVIPSDRISKVATEVLKYYPAPNAVGDGPARINNYVYPSRWVANMDQWIGRLDLVVNSKNTVYFRYGQNPFSEYRALVFVKDVNEDNPAEPTGNAPLIRNGRNWTWDWTSTISPTMTFNLRAGLARWEETTGNSYGVNYNPTTLGMDAALVGQFSKLQFPRFDLGSYQAVGTDRLINYAANDAYTVQPNLNLVVGRHFLKFGAEGRRYNDNNPNPGLASGAYSFGKNWTQKNANRADATSGDELATFLLGYPTSAYVDRNIDPSYRNHYWAAFLNDDWKVTPKLTVNVGLRWDYEQPRIERYDRMLRGLDFNAASPIASQVQGLNLKGAVLFAGENGQPRTAFNADKNNFQPRIGASYRIREKWVIRGGYGLYYLGQGEAGSVQGFSRRTTAVVSTDGNLTPAVKMTNPFALQPGGKLLDPIGSSLGEASFLGEGVTANYLDRVLPYSHQYSFDIQRELPGNLLVEAGYSGNITRKLPLNVGLNYVPANELGRRTADGKIDTAYYTGRVPNPMAGLIENNASLNGATISRQFLMYAFPQFSGVTLQSVPIGQQRYDAFLLKATKRMAHGLTFLTSYTISKTLEQVSLQNAQDFVFADPEATKLEKLLANELDTPQRFTVAGVWDFPFGKGRPFGGGWPSPIRYALGDWQMNWDIQYMVGWPVGYPNAAQVQPGSANLSGDQRTFAQWFNTSLWNDPATGKRVAAQEAYTLRTFPARFPDVRVPAYNNWDLSLSKYFPIYERVRAQFRFEMVNAFNHPWYMSLASGYNNVTSAAFGQLDPTQRNLPRFIKLALHMHW
ncbi:MAG TPA: TonB-dependent receptor [Bryobacteraceae bacterium]|nr:TonB-dependent receptor [Bryobacteraceae bacterium]